MLVVRIRCLLIRVAIGGVMVVAPITWAAPPAVLLDEFLRCGRITDSNIRLDCFDLAWRNAKPAHTAVTATTPALAPVPATIPAPVPADNAARAPQPAVPEQPRQTRPVRVEPAVTTAPAADRVDAVEAPPKRIPPIDQDYPVSAAEPPAAPPQVAEATDASFGLERTVAKPRKASKKPAGELVARVTDTSKTWPEQRVVYQLDNGQEWVQTKAKMVSIVPGDQVTITRLPYGRYLMQDTGGASAHVRRKN